jgi:hypothetical protein
MTWIVPGAMQITSLPKFNNALDIVIFNLNWPPEFNHPRHVMNHRRNPKKAEVLVSHPRICDGRMCRSGTSTQHGVPTFSLAKSYCISSVWIKSKSTPSRS